MKCFAYLKHDGFVWCSLVMQAAAVAAHSTPTDVTAAVEDAQEEWIQLRKSRIACWLRMSLTGTTSGTTMPQPLQFKGASSQPHPQGPVSVPTDTAVDAENSHHQIQQRRSSLKRSPLPRVCVVPQPLPEAPYACIAADADLSAAHHDSACIAPHTVPSTTPPLPLFHTDAAGAVAVATGDQSCPRSGDASTVSLDSWGAEDRDEFGVRSRKRRRSVRFSEQANLKHYEGMHEPSRVRGEPEVTQAVAVRSPVKCQVAARKERRGWWNARRPQNLASGGLCACGSGKDDDELEEGEVVESGAGCGGDASEGDDVRAHWTEAHMHGLVGLGMHAGGDVENESPVCGVLKMSMQLGSINADSSEGFGPVSPVSDTHSLLDADEQGEDLGALVREPM